MAELGERGLDRGLRGRLLGDVTAERRHPAVGRAHGLRHLLQRVGVDVDADYRRSLPRKLLTYRCSNAPAGARDDRHLALQTPHGSLPFVISTGAIIGVEPAALKASRVTNAVRRSPTRVTIRLLQARVSILSITP